MNCCPTLPTILASLGVPYARFSSSGELSELSADATDLLGLDAESVLPQARSVALQVLQDDRRAPADARARTDTIPARSRWMQLRSTVIAPTSAQREAIVLFFAATTPLDTPASHAANGPDADRLRQYFAARGLTARECDVACHLANGDSSKRIASALSVSIFTVRRHTERVFAKLGVKSRAQVVRHVREVA